ncbi:MAG: SAM-dependent methyltransferase, partial [Mesorhizobium sp.]
QYVRAQGQWRERMVGIDDHGALTFFTGMGSVDAALLPEGADAAPEGAIVELSPARSALMDKIAALVARNGGAGLFIDYGYAKSAIGDTLQVLHRHAFDDVLANPGEADLTSHVDFAALAGVADGHGLSTGLLEQGEFLLRMGLLDRAGRLGNGASEETQERIRQQVERLAAPDQMGVLFKALCVWGNDRPPPAFASPD